ncbi:hypothetical protein [Aurantiacibacter gangjinensis]|uniref:Uncharacterized protein n=1 Tax=Aurantiacibacter gangjinensis TaxID=502682 RepID=A0A0G9MPW4_9SPHN|nr:hypothetical protein [Aurantiacibacter gangjinensis]APE27225.1 hypothetical protein BMF35_a0396 [Aurantiacibacter gangjinensis]KLE31348.1 hypothetical protein AAW01_06990 [Aurantiacibacter gangjinensis]
MDQRTLWLSIIMVGGVLAVANAWRGAVLIRDGEKTRGSRHMMFTAAILMLTTVALLLHQQD